MIRAVAIAALAVGALLLTSLTHLERTLERRLTDATQVFNRYVDASVRLNVVEQDENGTELVEGKPKLRIATKPDGTPWTETHGGWIDTKRTPPQIVTHNAEGKKLKPGPGRDWYLSRDQYAAVRHTDPAALGQLVYGSEGAGKTRALAMWHYFRWLDHIGQQREGGQTAPTATRLEFVRKEMFLLFGRDWYRYRSADAVFVMCDGTRIQLVSTYRQSKDQGSPIQGFNWSWCGRDEAQDQVDVHEDIESRGRSAPSGLYWQLATATAKDDSAWRELRDVLLASGCWVKRALSIFRSPFTAAKFLADKAKTISPREFLRRYGNPKTQEVGDLPPELAVYYGWDRARNLVAKPQIATDVTTVVLAGYQSYVRPGARFTIAAGHDPGVIFNTTTIWKLLMFGNVPTWVAVDELQTKQTTARQHAKALREKLQNDHHVEFADSSKCAVFIDPHGKGEAQTDYQSVYMAFQKEGLDAFSPAPMTGKISRKARVEMMNRLLGGAAQLDGDEIKSEPARLVIAQVGGRPAAPHLVAAFEQLKKRPGDDNAEGTQRKDEDDKTHAPASAAYCLWPFEQEAFTENTVRLALAEARRVRA